MGCRCAVGLVFAVSFTSKVRGRSAFRQFLSSAREMGVPRAAVRPVGVIVAALEAVVVALVATPALAGAGLALATLLLATFAAAIGRAVRRGVHAPCRCFGSSKMPLGPSHVVRNVSLAVVSIAGAAVAAGSPARDLHLGGVAVAIASGAALAAVTVVFDDLAALFTGSQGAQARRSVGGGS